MPTGASRPAADACGVPAEGRVPALGRSSRAAASDAPGPPVAAASRAPCGGGPRPARSARPRNYAGTMAVPHHGRWRRAPVLAAVAVWAALPGSAGAVVGGTRVAPDTRPAVVRLAGACTATLVAPRRLLTAGHCASAVRPGATTVAIDGRRVRVSRVARHPGYRFLTPDYPAEPYRDLALVELAEDVGVRPVRVSRAHVPPGTPVVLLGYGTGAPDRPSSFGVLRRAALVVRSAAACRRDLDRANRGQGAQYRDRVMLCTQDPDGRAPFRSGCFGDSGAPLLRERRGRPAVLVGVDSWGVACGAKDGDPEVFARVSAEWRFVHARDPGWSTGTPEEPFAPGRF